MSVVATPKSWAILGRATLTIVPSMIVMNSPMM
jgi:hypothetical protein